MTAESADLLGNPSLVYSCTTVGANFVTVCAEGSTETTAVCGAFSVPPPAGIDAFALMQSLPGYESYTCNLLLAVVDSCGCSYDSGVVSCQNASPPPGPPPPSPPNPILPNQPGNYPHSSCFPGNDASQGGVDGGYQLQLTPFELNVTDRTANRITFRIDRKPCDPLNGVADCCEMDLFKIQVVLASSRCRVRRILIDGRDKSTSYETTYYAPPHPQQDVPYFHLKITSLNTDPIASVGSSVTLVAGGECSTIDQLLPDGQFWYAYFSNNGRPHCCGTARESSSPVG